MSEQGGEWPAYQETERDYFGVLEPPPAPDLSWIGTEYVANRPDPSAFMPPSAAEPQPYHPQETYRLQHSQQPADGRWLNANQPPSDAYGRANRPGEAYGHAEPYEPARTYRPAETYRPTESYPPAAPYDPVETYRPTGSYRPGPPGPMPERRPSAEAYRPSEPYHPGPAFPSGPAGQFGARRSDRVYDPGAMRRNADERPTPPPAAGRPVRSANGSSGATQTGKRRRRHTKALLATVLVLVVAAVAIGVVLVSKDGPKTKALSLATGPAIASAGPVLAPADNNGPLPTDAGIARVVAPLLSQARLGSHVGIAIGDLSSGNLIYGYHATDAMTPASIMKLATTISLLSLRSPSYRITTKVVAGSQPGEVVLVAAGDPTLATGATMSYPGSGRLDLLAAQVKQALGGVTPTKLIIDDSVYSGSAMGPGWQESDVESSYLTRVYALSTNAGRVKPTGDQRSLNSESAAAKTFARELGAPNLAISYGKAPKTATNPTSPTAPGAVLGSVQSAPIQRIIETMLSESDNMLAEAMARQVAIATGYPASFSGAAAAVTAELTKLGLPITGVHIVDGSGISHQNTLTPQLLAAILSYAAQPSHTSQHALFTGLPIAGYEGTLSGRYTSKSEKSIDGLFRAKTGTLDGVSTLAGVVTDDSGRLLTVVIMTNDSPSYSGAPQAIDKVADAIAHCGCT